MQKKRKKQEKKSLDSKKPAAPTLREAACKLLEQTEVEEFTYNPNSADEYRCKACRAYRQDEIGARPIVHDEDCGIGMVRAALKRLEDLG